MAIMAVKSMRRVDDPSTRRTEGLDVYQFWREEKSMIMVIANWTYGSA